ncbi:ABC transporter ATPase [Rhodococcus rhodochrous]|uniref:ABC transporter ATP-binding protein n=1 Tax=Rhodococcus rhodochrous TaxID=1829 RepID=A0AA46WZV0_RHORH|nr:MULTISPECIES: ABC transporter ATP-binding protein [Rhodococcus]MCB8912010.1 ABC transporter ATP-binding protein [Rhodococcus rhodochrous]MDJ0397050.1 ABC transporter ATP-binding protein [Rhodococcus rhodochrous]MDO1483132.1 ABC transporter ATP-binding protein [Rhodococcus rhodochrous]UZF47035.1 ABC transporter ATP-binding protein [Rhodococcus rhodochrous]SNV17747.1 ABC transporter ATPase [Rhodococcus rhodochrous]
MLDAKSISFRYSAKGPWIFEDVTVTACAGEVLAVLGPNARGKTTMLKCLSGLLTPVTGTVTSSGTIGYVPQSHAVAFSFTVLDIVLMGRARKVRIYSSPTNADRDAALDALGRVGILHLATRDYGGLSGGERQLVLIARALVSGCDTIVLDEPASALDLRNQARVLTVLRGLADDGMAVVMTTHHPDHALHIAERSMLMVSADDQRVGATRELLGDELLSEMYGVPIVTADVATPSALRRLTVPDFGRGIA